LLRAEVRGGVKVVWRLPGADGCGIDVVDCGEVPFEGFVFGEGEAVERERSGAMKQAAKRDRHGEIMERRGRRNAAYRKALARTRYPIDLAVLVREMREEAGLTQGELAKKAGTVQSVIARIEDAEYAGRSLAMLERIAGACGVGLRLCAEKKAVLRGRWSWCRSGEMTV